MNREFWYSVAYCAMALACSVSAGGCRAIVDSADTELPLTNVESSTDEKPVETTAVQWASWRGGEQHAVADDADLPTRWDAQEGIRWQTPIPGRGNSSPVVWGDRIFLLSEIEVAQRRDVHLFCLHRGSGELVWQTLVGPVRGASHSKNGHASATPAVNAKRVFAFVPGYGLACFNHDGERQWQAPLSDLAHEWGGASSPVLYGDLVIQLCDGKRESFLAAFDQTTGALRWRTERNSTGCWTTPVLVKTTNNSATNNSAATRMELVVNGTGRSPRGEVIAYAPDSGSELWRVGGTSDIPCPSIIVGDDLLFSTSGGNGPVMAIRPGGSGDVTATHVAWRQAVGGPYVPTGVYVEGRLFTIADSGLFRCLEAETGRELWRRRLRGAFTASLVAGGGCIYATSERGEVYVLAADDHYELLAVNSLNEGCFATPAIAEGEILLRTARRLYCISGRRETQPREQLADDDDPRANSDGANPVDGESEDRQAKSAEIPVLHDDPASPSDLPVDVAPSDVVPPSDVQSAAPASPPRLWRKLLERRRQR